MVDCTPFLCWMRSLIISDVKENFEYCGLELQTEKLSNSEEYHKVLVKSITSASSISHRHCLTGLLHVVRAISCLAKDQSEVEKSEWEANFRQIGDMEVWKRNPCYRCYQAITSVTTILKSCFTPLMCRGKFVISPYQVKARSLTQLHLVYTTHRRIFYLLRPIYSFIFWPVGCITLELVHNHAPTLGVSQLT